MADRADATRQSGIAGPASWEIARDVPRRQHSRYGCCRLFVVRNGHIGLFEQKQLNRRPIRNRVGLMFDQGFNC